MDRISGKLIQSLRSFDTLKIAVSHRQHAPPLQLCCTTVLHCDIAQVSLICIFAVYNKSYVLIHYLINVFDTIQSKICTQRFFET